MIISDEMLKAFISDDPFSTIAFWEVVESIWTRDSDTQMRMRTKWHNAPGNGLSAIRAAVDALRPYEQTKLLNILVLARLTS